MLPDRIDPKAVNVIDSKDLERDWREYPEPAFSHPALADIAQFRGKPRL